MYTAAMRCCAESGHGYAEKIEQTGVGNAVIAAFQMTCVLIIASVDAVDAATVRSQIKDHQLTVGQKQLQFCAKGTSSHRRAQVLCIGQQL